jgi:glucose-6-phosphate 1-dehydrogenase
MTESPPSFQGQSSPAIVIIFGASGDLTQRKLIPALYTLYAEGRLGEQFAVVGVARSELGAGKSKGGAEGFRQHLREMALKNARIDDRAGAKWNAFAEHLHYCQGEYDAAETYQRLAELLTELDTRFDTVGNRLFYLSTPPQLYPGIVEQLGKAGLQKSRGFARIIVEKPFGRDLDSAQDLNRRVHKVFDEGQVYRIDHYLGKETAQNVMVLRFANQIFENLWNNRYIDHVQITSAETLGVEARGPYYEKAGALRDMVQSHLLQLVCLTAMEPPTSLTADAVRDEKAKVIRSLRRLSPEDVAGDIVRGQYAAGSIAGKEVPAYRAEDRVDPKSMTETFVALKLHVDNWRWHGVPFYIRVGKRLAKSGAEIAVQFKEAPGVLFNTAETPLGPNQLVIRIQPDEGVSLRLQCKVPGNPLRIEPVKMDFHYGASFGRQSPEAYERLILDAMSGDATLFARRDEVQEAWRFVDAIEGAWHSADTTSGLFEYASGTWGPKEADALIERDGRTWRRM